MARAPKPKVIIPVVVAIAVEAVEAKEVEVAAEAAVAIEEVAVAEAKTEEAVAAQREEKEEAVEAEIAVKEEAVEAEVAEVEVVNRATILTTKTNLPQVKASNTNLNNQDLKPPKLQPKKKARSSSLNLATRITSNVHRPPRAPKDQSQSLKASLHKLNKKLSRRKKRSNLNKPSLKKKRSKLQKLSQKRKKHRLQYLLLKMKAGVPQCSQQKRTKAEPKKKQRTRNLSQPLKLQLLSLLNLSRVKLAAVERLPVEEVVQLLAALQEAMLLFVPTISEFLLEKTSSYTSTLSESSPTICSMLQSSTKFLSRRTDICSKFWVLICLQAR